ncbi:unnamed protein product [Amoebophrya sp. A25]|nr:unnamed protein product [Amoebophrya sp. A25]|eukprot:GSA25T00004718001.1
MSSASASASSTIRKSSSSSYDKEKKLPSDSELLAAAHREGEINRKLRFRISDYKTLLQARIENVDRAIKSEVAALVEESSTEISRTEKERIDILKQLTDLQEIRIKLEEAIQRKTSLKQRTETELKKGRRVALSQKKNQDVAAEVLRELKKELGKICASLKILQKDDREIQLDVDKLYRSKEVVEYVLDAKKTQLSIDKELLHSRFDFKRMEADAIFQSEIEERETDVVGFEVESSREREQGEGAITIESAPGDREIQIDTSCTSSASATKNNSKMNSPRDTTGPSISIPVEEPDEVPPHLPASSNVEGQCFPTVGQVRLKSRSSC